MDLTTSRSKIIGTLAQAACTRRFNFFALGMLLIDHHTVVTNSDRKVTPIANYNHLLQSEDIYKVWLL